MNIVYRAADFTDADCNAANAAAVVAAMHGMRCLPKHLVEPLNDRIAGGKMGDVKMTPPLEERISDLGRRTAEVGTRLIAANDGRVSDETLTIPVHAPVTQPAQLFALADLMRYWNPDWKLERAGFGGGAGGGLRTVLGLTHLDGDVLATWPRDPVRGVVLRRTLTLSPNPVITFQAGVDAGRAWALEIYADNKLMTSRLLDGGPAPSGQRLWEDVQVDLKEFAGKEVHLRLYQRGLLGDRVAGNAYWKDIKVE